jgi:zinc D-Ala-D-Ala carboxypeptidase
MAKVTDWAPYAPYFTEAEFRCKHTGFCNIDKQFLDRLLALRLEYAKPMRITSGYRAPEHPIEAAKARPGAHATGQACDVACASQDAFVLISLAIRHGFTGVGVSQRADRPRFIHLDTIVGKSRPNIWSY